MTPTILYIDADWGGRIQRRHTPLCDPRWDYFSFSRLAYRGHDVEVSWRRGRSGLTVALDGREAAHSPDLARLYIPLDD